MNNNIKVYCKQNCKSMGGAIFEKDNYYDCKVINNDTYVIFDKNNTILRLENDTKYPEHSQFKDFFYTEQQYRKEKLEKIYEITSRNKS